MFHHSLISCMHGFLIGNEREITRDEGKEYLASGEVFFYNTHYHAIIRASRRNDARIIVGKWHMQASKRTQLHAVTNFFPHVFSNNSRPLIIQDVQVFLSVTGEKRGE